MGFIIQNHRMKAQNEQTQKAQQPEKVQQPQKVQQQDPLAQLEKEQLLVMLKEKIKENKTLQNKNSKLETKYVDIFRQHKNMKKDYNVFLTIFKNICPEFNQKAVMGTHEQDHLQQIWRKRQQEFSEKLNQLIQETQKQKNRIRQQLQHELKAKQENLHLEKKNSSKPLHQEIENLKKLNKDLTEQLFEIDKTIDSKNQQIGKLTKEKLMLEHQINLNRVKSISSELTQNEQIQKTKEAENNSRNQFLALRQQVQNLLGIRDDCKRQIKNLKQRLKDMENQLISKNQKIKQLQQELSNKQPISQKELSINSNKQISNEKVQEKEKIESRALTSVDNQKSKTKDEKEQKLKQQLVHRQYVKNIVLRYFKSCNDNDETKSEILLNVLTTILNLNEKESALVYNSRKKAWWKII